MAEDPLAARAALNDELDRQKADQLRAAEARLVGQQQRLRELDHDDDFAAVEGDADEFESPARPPDARGSRLALAGKEEESSLELGASLRSEASAVLSGTDTTASSPFAAPSRDAKGTNARAAEQPPPSAKPKAQPAADRGARAPGSSAVVAAAMAAAASVGAEAELPEATGMGPEAAARYYRARVHVLGEELERLRTLLQRTATEAKEWELRANEATGARGKLERVAKDASARANREAKEGAEHKVRADELHVQLSGTRREADGVSRDAKAKNADARVKDVRLNRALEELEKTKAALAQAQADAKATAGPAAQAERAALKAENGRLRKQKAELLLAFKKQVKLIDVLKRQKLHVEAARAIQFTEEEFMRALQLGEHTP
mmetsp:Transcript_13455/g.34350  ORF Transcript_13455/g.34350 Transcript_13455/m.34350 type:complete len:379 (+) Transcript_13455:87-1223(+)